MLIRKDMKDDTTSVWQWALAQRENLDFSDLSLKEQAKIKSFSRHSSMIKQQDKVWFLEEVFNRLPMENEE